MQVQAERCNSRFFIANAFGPLGAVLKCQLNRVLFCIPFIGRIDILYSPFSTICPAISCSMDWSRGEVALWRKVLMK